MTFPCDWALNVKSHYAKEVKKKKKKKKKKKEEEEKSKEEIYI